MKHERVLGIYAHPDDADMGAGGTLARLASEGATVSIVVATLGDAGGFEAEGQSEISGVRRVEQENAAAALGIDSVTFLSGYSDGDLRVTRELQKDIVEQIRIHRPTLVLTMSPLHNWDSVAASHPDHRAIGESVVQAVYPAARNPFSFPELLEAGLEPVTVEEVWLQGHQHPNSVFELSGEDMGKKLAAVRCHVSQFPDMEGVCAYVVARARERAERAGLGEGTYAEEFFKYKTT